MLLLSKSKILRLFLILYNTVFGIGYIKYFPGSFASLFSISVFYILFLLNIHVYLLIIFFIFTVFSFYMVQVYLKVFQPVDLDSKEIVIDEFIGQFLMGLLWIGVNNFTDLYTQQHICTYMVIFFCLFRFFDILKPFPISWIDRNCKNFWGIILDDIVAAIFAFAFFLLYFLALSKL